jgi:short-subunit dehydrogenase
VDVLGKHIWLIGASEGIGAALAQQLAAAGAHVAISARNTALLNEVAATVSPAMRVLPLDVTDDAQVTQAWQALIAAWPQVDMVIYNAGAYVPMSAQQFDLTSVRNVVDVNLNGALRVLSQVLPYFIGRNAGHIALVGSVAGYRGLPASMGYGLSKAALIHLAENLRADLAATPIGVSIINPGFVKTRLTDKNDFHMPAMITPEQAATAIMQGFARDAFEIHFPKRFTYVMKLLRTLPYALYFRALRLIKL